MAQVEITEVFELRGYCQFGINAADKDGTIWVISTEAKTRFDELNKLVNDKNLSLQEFEEERSCLEFPWLDPFIRIEITDMHVHVHYHIHQDWTLV